MYVGTRKKLYYGIWAHTKLVIVILLGLARLSNNIIITTLVGSTEIS
jgi:hypothetical protein